MARSPNDVAASYYDKTLNLEGREELIDNIKEHYPDEYQKTEAEVEQDRLTEAIFNEESPENQALEEQGGTEFPTDVESITGLDPDPFNLEGFEGGEDIWSSTPPQREFLVEPDEVEKRVYSLDNPLDEREPRLAQQLKSQNFEDTVSAFKEINDDPALTAIFDTNDDGVFSYADMFDTNRWNNGTGITPQQDEEQTQKWLQALEDKDLRLRLHNALRNFWAVNKTEYIIDGRQSRLAPVEDVSNWDNNLNAGMIQSMVGTLNLPQQFTHWISGGHIGGDEGNRFGDWYYQQNNPNSINYLQYRAAKRHDSDGMWQNVGYWGTEGLIAARTLGFGSGNNLKHLRYLPRSQKMQALMRFMKPGVTVKGYQGAKGLSAGKWVAPATWQQGLGNLAWSLTKTGYLETAKGSYQYDFTYAAQQKLYEDEDSIAKWLIDKYPETAIFGAQLQWAIESPIGRRMALHHNEAFMEAAVGGVLFGTFSKYGARGLLTKVGKKTLGFGPKTLGRLRTDFSKFSWSSHPLSQKNFFQYWEQGQQKKRDIVRAAKVQRGKNIEPDNPFTEPGANKFERQNTNGKFKNQDSAINNEGIAADRYNAREILNAQDEIDGALLTRKGSTGHILDPTDLAIAARHGVNGPILERLTKGLVEDATLAEQLKSLDPASRTVGGYGEGSLLRQQEILGRDAASLSPREFWGDALVDMPLKAANLTELDESQRFIAENLFVMDAVNSALFSQLRDAASEASDILGKQDIFATDGSMKKIADNLTAGLSNVKKSRLTWSMLADRLKDSNGKLTPEIIDEVNSVIQARTPGLHDETVDGVRLMMQMMKDSDSDELADAVLDVFKVSNKIHNWKDFDAWMHQKLVGGEFGGKVKTGALIHELQGVMVNSILSGPKTPLRAILGTTVNAYLNAINEAAGATIRAPFTGDVIARQAAYAKLKGMFELIPEAWQVFRENWVAKFDADFADIRTRYSEAPTRGDYNWQLFGKYTEARGTDGEKAAYFITNTARTLNNNKLASWSPRALAATDDTYKWLMARARSKEIGMRKALEEAGEDWQKFSPELMKKAEDLHYRNLLDENGNLDFRNDSWLNKQFREITLTSELQGFSAKLDGLLNETPLLKPFYLFARTGINGLNLSYKNTPLLGALHKESLDILRHTGDDYTSLMKYGIENANDLANAKNLFAGRQAVGATVVTSMGMMYQSSQLTGNGPADRQLKQQWINSGWKPNHLYFGNIGFNYSSLEPYNVIFSAIADIGDNIELMGSEWAEKRLQAVGFVLGRGLTSKTYMSGLDQLMQLVQMKPGAWNKTAANVLNNSIPLAGMRNEFGKWINPHMKELNSDMWDSIRNRNQMSELVAGKNKLPVKHDILNGKPINNWNIIGRSFNAVSPLQLDIRNNSPGRQLLLNSNYDLKSTTYSYGGYSFAENARVRSHFQNTIGSVPIEFRGRKFKNLESALDYVSTLPDVKTSMKTMKDNTNNPAKWDVNPNDYPHNTIINLLMDQARAKAYAAMNQPTHPGYADLQEVKSKKDGLNNRTRDTRQEILELNYPTSRQTNFPK